MSDEAKKITYIVTHADDDPEMATIPFILANASMAMDITPVIILQSKGVMLALKGYAKHVNFGKGAPLPELIKNYAEAGGKLLICSPCMEKRELKESDLIEGSEVIGAARVNEEVLSSVNVLTY